MKNKKVILISTTAVLVVALVIALMWLITPNKTVYNTKNATITLYDGPEYCDPVMDFLSGTYNCNEQTYFSAFPPAAVKDYTMEAAPLVQMQFGYSKMADFLASQVKSHKDVYGADLEIELEYVSSKTVGFDHPKVKEMEYDKYNYIRYVTEENTQQIKEVKLKYSEKGSLDKDSRDVTVYLVKQEGQWYLHPFFSYNYI